MNFNSPGAAPDLGERWRASPLTVIHKLYMDTFDLMQLSCSLVGPGRSDILGRNVPALLQGDHGSGLSYGLIAGSSLAKTTSVRRVESITYRKLSMSVLKVLTSPPGMVFCRKAVGPPTD